MSQRHILYGSPISYYTGKVRAYLRYKRIPYVERMSTLRRYYRVIVPRTGVRMIPIVITPDDIALQDSTEIIDFLERRFPEPSVYPDTPRQRLASLLLEVYGDEWLLIPAMHYRWNYPEANQPFLDREFGATAAPWLPGPAKRWLGKRLGARFAGFVPALGILERTKPAIERWYLDLLDTLNRHFQQHDYLLGGRPTIGDFGFMAGLYAHLYRDPYPGRLMRERSPAVAAWVERMNDPPAEPGTLLADDEVPKTLTPVFHRIFEEQFPALIDTAERLAAWRQAHPGERIPRSIGRHTFRIDGTEGERAVLTYQQWMLQRPLDDYQSLGDPSRESVNAWLREVHGEEAIQYRPPTRVAREHNRLVFSDD